MAARAGTAITFLVIAPFSPAVSMLLPALDFPHRSAGPPGHSFGYGPVRFPDWHFVIKPALPGAGWKYPHNTDLPQSSAGYHLSAPWQSLIYG